MKPATNMARPPRNIPASRELLKDLRSADHRQVAGTSIEFKEKRSLTERKSNELGGLFSDMSLQKKKEKNDLN
jgi:hypothetical protein